MSCADVEPELIGYHFGTISPELRERLEAHLPTCPSCVKSLLLLKRQLETQPDVPAPSQAARDLLRAAVALQVGVAPWRWWERPVAFASAAAAAILAIFITWSVATGRVEVLSPLGGPIASAAGRGVQGVPHEALGSRSAGGVGAVRVERGGADQGRVRGRALHPERVRH
jgi:anti-sigma factor RsiW